MMCDIVHDFFARKDDSCAREDKERIIGKTKRDVLGKLIEKWRDSISDFYPKEDDIKELPQNSVLIKISFTLKKTYTSKGEGAFYITGKGSLENPIVRDKLTGLPMVRPSTWKGNLRFAAEKVEWQEEEEKKKIIKRLFGSEPEEEKAQKGRLYFFPTFFEKEAEKDVITPLDRKKRTPARGPIALEVMKPDAEGEFYLLYVPYPRGEDFEEGQIKEDLLFVVEALNLMFYIYGFSAKKTAGFGVIEREVKDGKIFIKGLEPKDFSNLEELKTKIEELWQGGGEK